MRQTLRNRTVVAVALAAGLSVAPAAFAPPSAAARVEPAPALMMPRSNGAFGFPVFGRSELRLLLSKRLKLVLDYRPTAFC